MRVCPVRIEPDGNGTLLVPFVDIPEAHTFTDDEAVAYYSVEVPIRMTEAEDTAQDRLIFLALMPPV